MNIPDRKPDIHEVLTLAQLQQAVWDYCAKWRGLTTNSDERFDVSLLEVHQTDPENGTYHLKMWRTAK